ncbi:hypothetical protein, partial [Petralouisia muris]|uniref:hypothetical protein n=1 Tax=Petralouisia muris TaxID=3032872 RepID=UPI0023B79386
FTLRRDPAFTLRRDPAFTLRRDPAQKLSTFTMQHAGRSPEGPYHNPHTLKFNPYIKHQNQ